MKPLLLAICAMCLCTVASAGPQKPGGAGGSKHSQPPGAGDRQSKIAQKLASNPAFQKLQAARSLPLTPSQQSALNTLESQTKQQLMTLRRDELKPRKNSGAQPQKIDQNVRLKMETISRDLSQKIDAILTPEQKSQLSLKTGKPAGGRQLAKGGNHQPTNAGLKASVSPAVAAAVSTPVAALRVAEMPTSGSLAAVNPFAP